MAPTRARRLRRYSDCLTLPPSTPSVNISFHFPRGKGSGVRFRKHLPERLHLDAREHTAGDVRIAVRERERFCLVLHIYNDKTAAAVGEWAREPQSARLERPRVRQMSLAYLGPNRGAVGSVMADNHEQHRMVLWKLAGMSPC